jgi:dipeptidyl aminopeptidase/acylaminoacyl peptidase
MDGAPPGHDALVARRFTARDVLRETRISQLAVAPDGSAAVYARRTIEGGEYRTRLWRVPLTRGRAEQITTGDLDVRPRFSPDGKTLLFLSRRSGASQPWLLPLAGGEPTQLAEFPTEVGAAEWSPDGERVLALAESGEDRYRVGGPEGPTARRITDLSWRLDLVGYRDQFTSLWVVPATGGKPKRLTEARYEVGQAFWSADGQRIGFLADRRPEAAILELLQAWTIPADGGRPAKLAQLPGEIAAAAWSPSGRLAFLGIAEEGAVGWANIGLWVKQGRAQRRLGEELDRTFCFLVASDLYDFSARYPPPLIWLDDENLLVLVTDQGTCVPYRFGLDGSAERLVERDDAVCSWLAAGGGRIAVVANVSGGASEVYAVEDGGLRQLSRNGSRWLAPVRREPERHSVRHRDGHQLDAWVLRPRGRRSRGLVLQIHGGPHLAHGPTPWLEMLALSDAGFTVLYGNPRGSVGYGEQFAKAIDGDWGNTDESDCLRLVDWAVRQGLGDRRHVGLLGLSYGGYMTNWLLGRHPGRFAAAVSENPVVDLFSFYGASDFGFMIAQFAAGVDEPWLDFARLLDRSPASQLHRNTAPLLLLQAEGDLRCPAAQTDLAFTMLRRLGQTVEMVRYPDEFHLLLAVGRPDRRVDRIERIVDWFERYL